MPVPRSGKDDAAVEDRDDHFELYDLRVDVICPEGAPIYCGAKARRSFRAARRDADPAGKVRVSRSIPSPPCCLCSPPSSARRTRQRLDDERRRDRLSRSELRQPHADQPDRDPPVQPRGHHRRAIAGALMETAEPRPGYVHLARDPRQLAARRRTRRDRSKAAARDAMQAAFDAGITTFDCADIYTGVEALIGAFRARLADMRGAAAAQALKVHTKLVPDLDRLGDLRRRDLEAIVDQSLRRLGVERLDVVQFHWWDYAVPGVLDAMAWLAEIAPRRQDLLRWRDQLRRSPHPRDPRRGRAAYVDANAIFAARRASRSMGSSISASRGTLQLFCYGTVAGAAFSATAGSASVSPRGRSRTVPWSNTSSSSTSSAAGRCSRTCSRPAARSPTAMEPTSPASPVA